MEHNFFVGDRVQFEFAEGDLQGRIVAWADNGDAIIEAAGTRFHVDPEVLTFVN